MLPLFVLRVDEGELTRPHRGCFYEAIGCVVTLNCGPVAGLCSFSKRRFHAGVPAASCASRNRDHRVTVPDICPLPTAGSMPTTNLNYAAKIELGKQLHLEGGLSR